MIRLALVYLLCCAPLVCVSKSITNANELLTIFRSGSQTIIKEEITFENDIDFRNVSITLPLGVGTDGLSCTSYGGKLNGNGYAIKNLHLNRLNSSGYAASGLFCALDGATIENLVIDKSCSFAGVSAGAVGVGAFGSVTFQNVTNSASVSGPNSVGGLLGYVVNATVLVKSEMSR